jgi:glycine/D-amino acid oxidase-like deaminating enzyme
VAEQALGFSVKAANQGILRLALKEMQLIDYQKTAAKYPDKTEWLSEEKCQQLVPNGRLAPGLLIRNGLSIYSALYLKGLWLACQSRGASFFLQEVQSLKELDGFDLIILATGADVGFLEESSHLMIRKVKGQILELSWPQGIPPLACTLNSQLYLLMGPSNTSCLLGATYEKNPTDSNISMEFALQELLPKGIELFPPLRDSHILNCYAGIRAVTPDRHPLVQKLSNRLWVLTGMGSKGLLYHALFAKKMVNDAMSEF